MSDQSPGRVLARTPLPNSKQSTDGHGGLRLLALAAVALGVLLLAAAAFVLSYAGIHAVALSAGVSPHFARIYPLIFDAMLVVAGAAVLALRSAGLPSRSYAWLSLLALLAAAAAADALHATGTRLPRRPAAATAAVIPFALVLIGFGLLLCMLRQARLRRAAAAAAQAAVAAGPSGHVAVRRAVVGLPGPDAAVTSLRGTAAANGDGAARPVPPLASPAADLASDLAIDAEPGHDDPASDEAGMGDLPEIAPVPPARAEQPAGSADRAASVFSPAPTPARAGPTAEVPQVAHPERGTMTQPDAEVGPAAAEPGADTQLEPAEAEATAGPGAEARQEAATGPAAAVETGEAADPPSAAPKFDRMRSSPVPPEA